MALQLLETEKTKKSWALRALGVTIILITLIFLGVMFFSIVSYQQILNARVKNWETKTQELRNALGAKGELEREIFIFQRQLNNFVALRTQVPSYSTFLASLENSFLKSAGLSDLKIAFKDNKIELNGKASDLGSVGFLVASLKEAPLYDEAGQPVLRGDKEIKLFNKVELTSASLNIENNKILYNFNITLTPTLDAFTKPVINQETQTQDNENPF